MVNFPLSGTSNLQAVRERVSLLLRGCKCATGCSTGRCGCKKSNRQCSEGCQCKNCSNVGGSRYSSHFHSYPHLPNHLKWSQVQFQKPIPLYPQYLHQCRYVCGKFFHNGSLGQICCFFRSYFAYRH